MTSLRNPNQTIDQKPPIPIGTVIKDRWTLKERIGVGSYGYVYSAVDTEENKLVAVKFDNGRPKSREKIKVEWEVLKLLRGNPRVVNVVEFGVTENEIHFLVLTLLGADLGKILTCQPGGRFRPFDVAQLMVQMLPAIKCVHDIGYIHRDIKPSNFAISSARNVVIFDFGGARRYKNNDGTIVEARSVVTFSGNPLYASTSALSGMDDSVPIGSEQCRKDDLWGLLYTIVMFFKGGLPWMFAQNWEALIFIKKQTNRNQLLFGLRNELFQFYDHLSVLKYGDEPDYELLQSLLDGILKDYTNC